jgi:hypothetical protein
MSPKNRHWSKPALPPSDVTIGVYFRELGFALVEAAESPDERVVQLAVELLRHAAERASPKPESHRGP